MEAEGRCGLHSGWSVSEEKMGLWALVSVGVLCEFLRRSLLSWAQAEVRDARRELGVKRQGAGGQVSSELYWLGGD